MKHLTKKVTPIRDNQMSAGLLSNKYIKGPNNQKIIIYLSNIGKPDISDDEKLASLQKEINHEILLNAAEVVEVHCAMCHAKYPSWERMSRPPKGLILANKDDIILNIDSLYQQVVLSNAMPPGNITWMEYSERETIKLLYQEILKNRNTSSLWQQFKEIL